MVAFKIMNVKLMEEMQQHTELNASEKFNLREENENAVKTSKMEPS